MTNVAEYFLANVPSRSTQVCMDARIATACPCCYKKMNNECHCLLSFKHPPYTILIGRVTLILFYVCLALRLSTTENGACCLGSNQRLWCFIVAWRAFRATARWMTLSLLIEPHWATGVSFKQNLPRVEATSPLMRDHCRRTDPAVSRARPHFPLSEKQTDAVMWALWED